MDPEWNDAASCLRNQDFGRSKIIERCTVRPLLDLPILAVSSILFLALSIAAEVTRLTHMRVQLVLRRKCLLATPTDRRLLLFLRGSRGGLRGRRSVVLFDVGTVGRYSEMLLNGICIRIRIPAEWIFVALLANDCIWVFGIRIVCESRCSHVEWMEHTAMLPSRIKGG